jgi:hypothetical protein
MGTRRLTTLLVTATLAIGVSAASAIPASAATGGPTAGGMIARATHGCGGALVLSPRPGTQLTARELGMPASADAFYAQAARHHARWLSTMSCAASSLRAPLPAAAGRPAGSRGPDVTYKSNWAGYEVLQTAQYVQGTWTVPTVTGPGEPGYGGTTGYFSASWDGIGGGGPSGTDPLIQAGTEQDLPPGGPASYSAWYAFGNPSNAEVPIAITVRPGNLVGNVALWTAAGGAEIGFCNLSDSPEQCVQVTQATSEPSPSAEWVVEAPYQGGVPLPLANFGTEPFSNGCWAPADVKGATCYTIAAGNPAETTLWANEFGASQELASPGSINSAGNGFADYYSPPVRCLRC